MNINVYGGYYSTFVRNANKLSCSKLKLVRALLRKRLRRLTRNWFMRTTNAQQIKNLKRRLNYIHRTIVRKCAPPTGTPNTASTGGAWWGNLFNFTTLSAVKRRKLIRCIRQATLRFPLPPGGGWLNATQRMITLNKRRAFVKQCMRSATNLPGFDGSYSNQSGPIMGNYTNTPGILPGTTHTSIPRPARPTPVLPPPMPAVPYHTHNVVDTNIRRTGGPNRIASPYQIPRPVQTPPNPISPGQIPVTRNFGGEATRWQDDLPTG